MFVAAAYAKTNECNAMLRACQAVANRNALATRVCSFLPRFDIMFLDTLCSKKSYDMPHIRCSIHALQWSTISRIGRHSAGYN